MQHARLALIDIRSTGASGVLSLVESIPNGFPQLFPLATAQQIMFQGGAPCRAEHTANRIPQQVNVCEILNIGFSDRRVTAPAQGLAKLFAYDRMAALHDQLVDIPNQIRAQQVHIVYQYLIVVELIVTVGMTKKFA